MSQDADSPRPPDRPQLSFELGRPPGRATPAEVDRAAATLLQHISSHGGAALLQTARDASGAPRAIVFAALGSPQELVRLAELLTQFNREVDNSRSVHSRGGSIPAPQGATP